MSHRIAEAKRLGMTGRAADRLGHTSTVTPTPTARREPSRAVVTPTPLSRPGILPSTVTPTPARPSAKTVLNRFETSPNRNKSASFLQSIERGRERLRMADSVLIAKSRIDQRTSRFRDELLRGLTKVPDPTEASSILDLINKDQNKITQEEIERARIESKFTELESRSKVIPGIDVGPVPPPTQIERVPVPTPTPFKSFEDRQADIADFPVIEAPKALTAEEREERKRLRREEDPQLRKFLPDTPKERLQQSINETIKNDVPEDLQDAVKGEVNLRQSEGEVVSPNDIEVISNLVNPDIKLEFNKLSNNIVLIDPTDEDAILKKSQDEEIRELAFSGQILDEDILDTPGKEHNALLFARAGELFRDFTSARRFIDLEEGEETPPAPLVVPEEQFSELPTEKLSFGDALLQAEGELQFELEELNIQESSREIEAQMEEFRNSTNIIGGAQLDDISQEERNARVRDKWAAALYDVDDYSGLNQEQAEFFNELIVEPPGRRGFNRKSQNAVTNMLDLIDPDLVPEQNRVDLIEGLRDMAHGEQEVKISGAGLEVSLGFTPMQQLLTILTLWKWPAYTTLFFGVEALEPKITEATGLPPVVGTYILPIAAAALGGPKLTRLTNSARQIAALKTPLLPIAARQGLLPKVDVSKLTPKPITQLEIERINLRNLRVNPGAETIIDPAGNTISRNIRREVTTKRSVTQRDIARLGKEEREATKRALRSVPSDAEALAQDGLAHISVFEANIPGQVGKAIAKAAATTEKNQRKAQLEAFEAEIAVDQAIFNFISKTNRVLYETFTGEAPLITRLKEAQKTLITPEGTLAVAPLKPGELKKLESLQKFVDNKVPQVLSPGEKFKLKAFRKQEIADRQAINLKDKSNEFIRLLNKEKEIEQGIGKQLSATTAFPVT